MSQKFPFALVDGAIIPFDAAQISLAHPVFLTSFGVYESIQVENGHPFCLDSHITRLLASAVQLAIELPPFATLRQWGDALIRTLPAASYALHMLAIGANNGAETPTVAFLPKPIARYPAEYYTMGAAAITYPGERLLPQCKSFNTLINHLARAEARRNGALEALLVSGGQILEGARSNVFGVDHRGRLITPPAAKTLSGITKEVLLHEMATSPTPLVEADLPADAPLTELFITSTSMHVMPITRLNGQPVGDGRVGTVTRMAMERFEAFFRATMRKALE